jgi:hypothetical protein
VNMTVGGGAFRPIDIVNWINGLGLAGLSAVTNWAAGNERRAAHMSHASLSGPTVAFPAGGIAITSGGTQFTGLVDEHADLQQNFGFLENCAYRFVTCHDLADSTTGAQFYFNDHSASDFKSMGYRNYDTKGLVPLGRGHFNSPHHSVLVEHMTAHHVYNLVRSNAVSAEDFAPTRVVVRKSIFETFAFTGTSTAMAGLTLDGNYSRTGAVPAGSINTPAGSGTNTAWTALVVDPTGNNYTPLVGGHLDLPEVIGRYNTDGSDHSA